MISETGLTVMRNIVWVWEGVKLIWRYFCIRLEINFNGFDQLSFINILANSERENKILITSNYISN